MKKRVSITNHADGSKTKRTTYTWKTITGTKSETHTEKIPAGKKGCYVATTVYGSYDCPQVWTLRRFRDEYLENSIQGRVFIKIYYTISPTMVKLFGETAWFNSFFKKRLDAFVDRLNQKGFSNSEYQDS